MRTIIAVDPGASGGIVCLTNGTVKVWPMPATEGGILDVLRECGRLRVAGDTGIAYVEQIVKHIGAGIPASTMAVYASNWGISIGALMMAGWRVELPTPQLWQKTLGLGIIGRQQVRKGLLGCELAMERDRVKKANSQLKRDWKNKLLATAQRLYPGVTVTLKTSDALLLAEYARRMQ